MPCGHTRIAIIFCQWVLDNQRKSYRKLKGGHPSPILQVKHIEDPTDAVCLCQMGIRVAEETDVKPACMFWYRESSLHNTVLEAFADDIVVSIEDAIGDDKIDPVGNKMGAIPEFDLTDAAILRPTIFKAQKLWVTNKLYYSCNHFVQELQGPKALADVPNHCPRGKCRGPLVRLFGVTDKEPGTGATFRPSPWFASDANREDTETWDIAIIGNYEM